MPRPPARPGADTAAARADATGAHLLEAIRNALRDAGDPVKAPQMQAYMKSAMPYRGVPIPLVRSICRELFSAYRLPTFALWRDTARTLWRDARFREERYAAIELTSHRDYEPFQRLAVLPLYREMIVTGAWWDFVDAISHRIGGLLRRHPEAMARTLRAWAVDDDIWLRRAAILAQLDFKEATDLRLLYDCIDPSIDRREFFLCKGIGWALRQYARVNPREVLRFVRANRTRLSPLTKREALKAQLRDGTLARIP